jgi:hypothetical protein
VLTSRSAIRQNADPGCFSHFSPVFATLVGQIDPFDIHVGMPVNIFLVMVDPFTRKARLPIRQSSTFLLSVHMVRIGTVQ